MVNAKRHEHATGGRCYDHNALAAQTRHGGFTAPLRPRYQYASELFQELLEDNGIKCSMSRACNVWDNSAMESFFSSLKSERVHRSRYRMRDEARSDIFDYIERFYNPQRRHSTLNYVSPVTYERSKTAQKL